MIYLLYLYIYVVSIWLRHKIRYKINRDNILVHVQKDIARKEMKKRKISNDKTTIKFHH